MPPISRNPERVKQFAPMIDEMITHVMGTERKRLKKVLMDLIVKNTELGGTPDAYRYLGQLYTHLPFKIFRHIQVQPIHQTLEKHAVIYLENKEAMDQDERKIRQALSVVTSRCQSVQDFRDVLPDSLVAQIPSFRGLRRKQDEGFVLKEMPLQKAQFTQAMNLALSYQANQIIF